MFIRIFVFFDRTMDKHAVHPYVRLPRKCTNDELKNHIQFNKKAMELYRRICPRHCSDFEVSFAFPNKLPKSFQDSVTSTKTTNLYITFPDRVDRLESLEGITFLGKNYCAQKQIKTNWTFSKSLDVLGNVGGNLGLWLGLCVANLDIIYYWAKTVKYWKKKVKNHGPEQKKYYLGIK